MISLRISNVNNNQKALEKDLIKKFYQTMKFNVFYCLLGGFLIKKHYIKQKNSLFTLKQSTASEMEKITFQSKYVNM